MKTDYWIIVVVLLLLTGLTGMMRQNTILGQQEQQLIEQGQKADWFIAQAYWTRMSLLPPPFYPPLEGAVVSSACGYRTDPMGGAEEALHKGIDLVGPKGATVYAALAGRVVDHWPSPTTYWRGHPIFGGLIVLDHGGGLFTLSGHLSSSYVHEGDWVEAGQPIGIIGDTGIATGRHLHFEVVVDPLRYLEGR